MSKFKVGDRVMVGGQPNKVTKVLEETYYNTTSACRIEERYMTAAPAETDRERRGRELHEHFDSLLRKNGYEVFGHYKQMVKEWREAWSDLAAEYPERREATEDEVERVAQGLEKRDREQGYVGLSPLYYPDRARAAIAAMSPREPLTAKPRISREELAQELSNAYLDNQNIPCERVNLSDEKYRREDKRTIRDFYLAVADRAIKLLCGTTEPLTAVMISDEELTKGIAGAWYGDEGTHTQHPDAWKRSAGRARELLCKNAVEVDFVVTGNAEPYAARITPVSEKARKLFESYAYFDKKLISRLRDAEMLVEDFQHQGFTVLVR